jgi:hypothetical protein
MPSVQGKLVFQSNQSPNTEGTFEMHSTSTTRVRVESGGTGVAAHVGLHALGTLADQLGLGAALSERIVPRGERMPVHDRGKVLVQMALVLAGGGESCSDIEHLRAQPELFGSVPSDTTVFRTFHELIGWQRAQLAGAMAKVRARVWRKLDTDRTAPVILDIDASLVDVHCEAKEQAAPTYKGGYGFHPMFCFADLTGEALSSKLRPGNSGANDVQDHVTVLDQAIDQLPDRIAAGHRPGDEDAAVRRQVIVRADAAGCTSGFLSACRARKVSFFVTARTNARLASAIYETSVVPSMWSPSVSQNGEPRDGASVCEVTELVDLSGFPDGTRCIIRREPLHQGAQRSLFFSMEFRYWGFYTDCDGDPTELDAMMRAHAHVENHIQRLKDSGLCRMPFTRFEANSTWLMAVAMAADLVRWFQLLCLKGTWRDARPKALRWELFHAPGRLVHRSRCTIVRVLEGWPTAAILLAAHRRIALLI